MCVVSPTSNKDACCVVGEDAGATLPGPHEDLAEIIPDVTGGSLYRAMYRADQAHCTHSHTPHVHVHVHMYGFNLEDAGEEIPYFYRAGVS